MQLSEEISCVRLGFRRGHALSAAQVPAGSQQMTRRSIENPRRNQYRGMIPLMQVALFLRQAQTLRNLLRERQECRKIVLDGWYLQGHTSPGHCVSNHLLAMSTTLNLVTEMERIASALGTEQADAPQVSLSSVAEKIAADAAGTIQKMISAPILMDGKVIGVIQVSRKGANPHSAGPDFTAADLGKILALCKPLGKLLRHVAGE